MTPFLQQVAGHYYATGEIWTSCFIFPNRRSLAFFRKYVSEAVAADPGASPRPAPECCTINDFFYRAGGFAPTDKVTLLLELYEVYKTLSPLKESLDEFIFWGDVLLGDFDDVDKYLVDASELFTNAADLRKIQDNYEYLSETQKTAIVKFAHRIFQGAPAGDGFKGKFLRIWDILGPLYVQFRERLRGKGLAYEGMVYRDLAERIGKEAVADILKAEFPRSERFVFVGLNALSECEKKVLARMRDASLARFVWDYRSKMIRDGLNKSSLFMRKFTEEFRSDFDTDPDGLPDPEFNVISVPSGVGQAKLLPALLKDCAGDPLRTAVVLPDETLLTPVLSSIPPEVEDINVTMGCPMAGSAFFTLMSQIVAMQMHLRERADGWYFYHRQVHSILTGNLFRSILTEQEAARCTRILKEAKYYIPLADIASGELLSGIFRAVVTAPAEASIKQISALVAYLQDVVRLIAGRISAKGANMLELDFARRYYTAIGQLCGKDLEILPATFLRLADRLLATLTVPFSGEPLKGLQIMGPLETRALDFDNVIILSSNEGVFPRRSVSSSLIPPELRSGYGLPNYEYQDAVWAYYFYRLIQRASKVFLVYDSRTEGIKTGEESRYIKQLEYHFGIPLHRKGAQASIRPASGTGDIPKTDEDVEAIRNATLSASSLQNYLTCPAKFYYGTVKHLAPEDEVAENLDAGMVGRIFHKVMQNIYTTPDHSVSAAYLEEMRGKKDGIRKMIFEQICSELHTLEVTGRDLVTAGVIQHYVEKALSRDVEYLKEHGADAFEIIGLEDRIPMKMDGFNFIGFVDRIDRIPGGRTRVLDYKTGKVTDDDIHIDDGNAEKVAEALFGESNENRPKIALQLYLYDVLVAKKYGKEASSLTNSIYSTSRMMSCPVEDVKASGEFQRLAGEGVRRLLDEMVDKTVPFRRRKGEDCCDYCDFKILCGK